MMAYMPRRGAAPDEERRRFGWVLKEATILAWRAAIEPDFRLFVVRLPEVKDEELRAAKFDPLMLNVMQRVIGQDADSIAKELIKSLPAIRLAETPLDELMEELIILLKQVAPERLAKKRSPASIAAAILEARPGYPAASCRIDGPADRAR